MTGLPGVYALCLFGHYFATRGDEDCPVCMEIARLKAELAEWKAKSEESFAFYEDLRKQYEAARKELAGSENNRRAMSKALDDFQRIVYRLQNAL